MTPKVYQYKDLKIHGERVFGKIVIDKFDRIKKFFQEDEACFIGGKTELI